MKLISKPFTYSLFQKLAVDLDELQRRFAKFMQLEELHEFKSLTRAKILQDKKEIKKLEQQQNPLSQRSIGYQDSLGKPFLM